MYSAKKVAQENFQDLKSRDGINYIFKLAKLPKGENREIIGE